VPDFGFGLEMVILTLATKGLEYYRTLEGSAGKIRMNKKRIIGVVLSIVGFIVGWVGYGMWRSPELDWASFKHTGGEVLTWFGDEIVRLVNDPFAILGIVVMIGGIIVLIKGIGMVGHGQKSQKSSER
jgi:hypothetical protein